MVDLGPTGPPPGTPASELINYWTHGPGSEPLRKPAAERAFHYVQEPRSLAERVLRRPQRRRRYVVRVTEDHAGRRRARTERYDPIKGGGLNRRAVDLKPLPTAISLPMLAFGVAVFVILMVAPPFPFGLIPALYWALSLFSRMASVVQRARMARHLRRLPGDLPPLLTSDQLDARLFALANPDDDRTDDDPAPIPLPALLRDRAWQRWEDTYSEAAVREAGRKYMSELDTYFGKQPSAETRALADRVQDSYRSLRKYSTMIGENALRNEFAALDVESERVALIIGCELRGIEHPRMFTAPPQLERPFAAETDCADGHVGNHPIIATFVDRLGRQRVTRACRWCPSEWSDRV